MMIGDASVRAMKPSFTLRTDFAAAGTAAGAVVAPGAFTVVGVALAGAFAGTFVAAFFVAAPAEDPKIAVVETALAVSPNSLNAVRRFIGNRRSANADAATGD